MDDAERARLEQRAFGSRDAEERREALEALRVEDARRPAARPSVAAPMATASGEDGTGAEASEGAPRSRAVAIGAAVAVVALVIGALVGWRLSGAQGAPSPLVPGTSPSTTTTAAARIDPDELFAGARASAPTPPLAWNTTVSRWYAFGSPEGGDADDPTSLWAGVDAVDRPCLLVETTTRIVAGTCASTPGIPATGLTLTWQSGRRLATAVLDADGVDVASRAAPVAPAIDASDPFALPSNVMADSLSYTGDWSLADPAVHGRVWTALESGSLLLCLVMSEQAADRETLIAASCAVRHGDDGALSIDVDVPEHGPRTLTVTAAGVIALVER